MPRRFFYKINLTKYTLCWILEIKVLYVIFSSWYLFCFFYRFFCKSFVRLSFIVESFSLLCFFTTVFCYLFFIAYSTEDIFSYYKRIVTFSATFKWINFYSFHLTSSRFSVMSICNFHFSEICDTFSLPVSWWTGLPGGRYPRVPLK